MMQVYDLRVDVDTGTPSRFSAALRVLYSLKSMTLIRITACTRASCLDTDRSSHDGLFGVVTRFTGSPQRGAHFRRIETLAAWALQPLCVCCRGGRVYFTPRSLGAAGGRLLRAAENAAGASRVTTLKLSEVVRQ
jgi:hypothetical protein